MQDVARTVKKALNEAYGGNIMRQIVKLAENISKTSSDTYEILFRYPTPKHTPNTYGVTYKNGKSTGGKKYFFNALTDDCFEGNILEGQDAADFYKNVDYNNVGYVRIIKFNDYSNPPYYIIKLSDKGIEMIKKILEMKDARWENKKYYERGGQEIEREYHKKYEMRFEKLYREDKKEADEAGVSVEDYIIMGIISERMSAGFGSRIHFDDDDYDDEENFLKNPERIRKSREYFEYLEKKKGIVINQKTIRKTLLRALSKFNN